MIKMAGAYLETKKDKVRQGSWIETASRAHPRLGPLGQVGETMTVREEMIVPMCRIDATAR